MLEVIPFFAGFIRVQLEKDLFPFLLCDLISVFKYLADEYLGKAWSAIRYCLLLFVSQWELKQVRCDGL